MGSCVGGRLGAGRRGRYDRTGGISARWGLKRDGLDGLLGELLRFAESLHVWRAEINELPNRIAYENLNYGDDSNRYKFAYF
ncbi:hypothetical protein GCM10010994_04150 [Chelatococcus reniformis]|uniref:Uncharacterized protein n=1 Tax=Chelatococcus reniformis TaxID=1494448 RepID=A0A916TX44_9HYPH|nr:hypothetical protein GCM10010994_04150 [Chelatococcus reniformis]